MQVGSGCVHALLLATLKHIKVYEKGEVNVY